jgi:hypothetical protein
VRLTDRSRHERGLRGCQRARWYEYEYLGTGLRPKAQRIALATGTEVHEAVEAVLRECHDGVVPDPNHARAAIARRVIQYEQKAREKGFYGIELTEQAAYLVSEQACLVEGLAWAFYRAVLPWLLTEFTILAIEQSVHVIVGCDCGLSGVGEPVIADGKLTHEGRACGGTVIPLRPDVVARRHSDESVVTIDLKTSAYEPQNIDTEHVLQMSLSALAASRITGEPCSQYYLIGLHKGQRKAPVGGGMKTQQSPLCYLYHCPADPPYAPDRYSADYTRARGFGRVPVWECFPEWKDTGISPVEHWVMEIMSPEEVGKTLSISQPQFVDERLAPEMLVELHAEAVAWDDIRAAVAADPGGIDTYIRRSWDCHPYGEDCEFLRICKKKGDWGAPENDGFYEEREPHHLLELELHKSQQGQQGQEDLEERKQ